MTEKYLNKKIIIVPCCEQGHGGGHLSRSITLVKDLRSLGREALLFIPQNKINSKIENLFQTMSLKSEWIVSNDDFIILNPEFIVLDRFQTPLDEILQWKKTAPVIGIDEGGSYRGGFDFLIDILIPENFEKTGANISSPSLLVKKNTAKRHKPPQTAFNALKVLITFGHEDNAGLGFKTARFLSEKSKKFQMDITLLRGSLANNSEQLSLNNVKIQDVIPNLAERLFEYDLVITHYGLTAYEAVYSGTPVFLSHPTSYHKKLAKAAGFKTLTKKSFNTNYTNRREPSHEYLSAGSRLEDSFPSLGELINSFSPQVNHCCPVCGAENTLVVSRFTDRTYKHCKKCGIIYMDRTSPPPVEYEKEYFFESYKRQYGKTYLEDFENIKTAAKRRLKIIEEIISQEKTQIIEEKFLLDIGCAYGPFLASAKEEGYVPTGIDPAEDAVRYVQHELKITAIHGFFPINNSSFLLPASFNVITLWFVIEHFRDCVSVFKEINNLLKPNGILAFSTPSFSGISGRKSLRGFLSASPADHYTVWSPEICRKALAFAGFNVKKIVSIGHHPERFPLIGRFAKSRKSPVYRILMAVSRLFKLGDTFEVYAVKN